MACRLAEKVAIVTGSSSGIGQAIAMAYAREGAVVVCADLKREAQEELREGPSFCTDDMIRSEGGRAVFAKTNVSLPEDFEALIQAAVKAFGRLDMYVVVP